MDDVDGSRFGSRLACLDADLQADSAAVDLLPGPMASPKGKPETGSNLGKDVQSCYSADSGCLSDFRESVNSMTGSLQSMGLTSPEGHKPTSHSGADEKVVENVNLASNTDSCLGPSIGSLSSVAEDANFQTSPTGVAEQELLLDETDLEEARYIDMVRKCYSQDEDGDTTLHVAIIQKQEKWAEQIISLAPSPEYLNFQNNLRQTPLHLAALTDQCALVRHLVVMGACIDLRDRDGNTPLHLACARGHIRCVRNLVKVLTTEEVETFESWDSTNEMTIPQDVNLQNYEGLTCLHVAAENGHYETVEYLVSPKFGASVDQKDGCSGRTILHHAVERHNIQMLVFLVTRCKADVNARTFDKHTPLQLAAGRQYVDVANALIRAGANKEQLYESEAEEDEEDDEEMDEDTERT